MGGSVDLKTQTMTACYDIYGGGDVDVEVDPLTVRPTHLPPRRYGGFLLSFAMCFALKTNHTLMGAFKFQLWRGSRSGRISLILFLWVVLGSGFLLALTVSERVSFFGNKVFEGSEQLSFDIPWLGHKSLTR